jgi:hypothetical protein
VAQFALSHACWLITYPLADWLGATAGILVTLGVLGAVTLAGLGVAMVLWPADDADVVEHTHADLRPDHPHLREHRADGLRHTHIFVIDDLHQGWPQSNYARSGHRMWVDGTTFRWGREIAAA